MKNERPHTEVVPTQQRGSSSSSMALTFIGISPDPLPLPEGLSLESKRYTTGPSTEAYSLAAAPTPSLVKVRYTYTDPEGRLKTSVDSVEEVPDKCTVGELIALILDHGPTPLQMLSMRQPILLRYHGQTMRNDAPLSSYSLKNGAELQLVVKPRLTDYEALEQGDPKVTRLRVMSHKLQAPMTVTELGPSSTIGDVKRLLRELLSRAPIWLVKGAEPLKLGSAPAPILLPQADGEGNDVELRVGDQLMRPAAADGGGGGGGGKGKKGGGGLLRRVRDGQMVEQAKADPECWQLVLDPEDTQCNLFFNGFILPDEKLVSECRLIHNDMLYLNFKAPWEMDEPVGKEKEAKEKGGKKK
jgi:hypothetical protein